MTPSCSELKTLLLLRPDGSSFRLADLDSRAVVLILLRYLG
jgi:hypothetical protein